MALPYSRVLVTGAGAFIGSHVCQALAQAGVNVHALTLDGRVGAVVRKDQRVMVHTADITDAPGLRGVVEMVKPEVVFHLAAYGTLTRERDIQPMVDVNILGTQNLLTSCAEAGCRAFVYAGSAKEYAPSRTPIREDQRLAPWDEYAAAKAGAGVFCRLAAERTSMAVTVLRLSPVYGPGEDASRFVPTAIRAALGGIPFAISVGPLVRNFTYIDDIVDAFLRAGQRSEGRYQEFNIGTEEVTSFHDILMAVEKTTGRAIIKNETRMPSAKDDSWVLDCTKARRVLGWEAAVSLTEGIRRTVLGIQSAERLMRARARSGGQHR